MIFTVEPTQEELSLYEEHLRLQVRPPPIYSPTLPQPYVILGASEDPTFYTKMQDLVAGLQFDSRAPFGELLGFRTSRGIVSVPVEPIIGYAWIEETRDWVIAARD